MVPPHPQPDPQQQQQLKSRFTSVKFTYFAVAGLARCRISRLVPRDPRYDPFSFRYSIAGNLSPKPASHIRTQGNTILSRSRYRAPGTIQTSFAIASPDRVMNNSLVK